MEPDTAEAVRTADFWREGLGPPDWREEPDALVQAVLWVWAEDADWRNWKQRQELMRSKR